MPHLHIEEFKSIDFPQSQDGVTFNFMAKMPIMMMKY